MRVEKVEARLGATSKLKRNKEDQLEYLMESLEEARGNLEACHKSRTRLGNDYVSQHVLIFPSFFGVFCACILTEYMLFMVSY
jgi:hypothetical protein